MLAREWVLPMICKDQQALGRYHRLHPSVLPMVWTGRDAVPLGQRVTAPAVPMTHERWGGTAPLRQKMLRPYRAPVVRTMGTAPTR